MYHTYANLSIISSYFDVPKYQITFFWHDPKEAKVLEASLGREDNQFNRGRSGMTHEGSPPHILLIEYSAEASRMIPQLNR